MTNNNFGLLDISKMLSGIEIDSDAWVGLSTKQKLHYLKTRLKETGYGEIVNNGLTLAGGILSIIRSSTSNNVVKRYLDVAELGLGLVKATMVINNTFVSKHVIVESEYDDLAKFMGYRNGNEIITISIDSTPEIAKSILRISKESQEKYGFKVIRTNHENEKTDGTPSEPTMNTFHMLASMDDCKFGLEVGYVAAKKGDGETLDDDAYSYITVGFSFDNVVPTSDIEKVIYGNYIDHIDVEKNFIRIDNMKMHVEPRKNIDFDLNNIDLADMARTMHTVLDAGLRRGYMIQGDAGTGKTVSIYKLMMSFPKTPVFMISADSISDVKKMRVVFGLLNMFPGSIFVFDDIDGNDFSIKNQLTTTFIQCIDATSSDKFSGIIILTVNEPQRIHYTIKTRAERIDEVILVHNPNTVEQIVDIVSQRYRHMKKDAPYWVNKNVEHFIHASKMMIDANFTHAHVAGVVSDLVTLYPNGYDCATFEKLIQKRIESIANAKMVASDDGHIDRKPMV